MFQLLCLLLLFPLSNLSAKPDTPLGSVRGNNVVARFFDDLPEGYEGPWVVEIIKDSNPEEFLVRGVNVIEGLEGKGLLSDPSAYSGTAEPKNFPFKYLLKNFNRCTYPDGAIYYLSATYKCPVESSDTAVSHEDKILGKHGDNIMMARYFEEFPEDKKGPWIIEVINGKTPEEFLVRGANYISSLQGKGYLNLASAFSGTAEPSNFPWGALANYNRCTYPDGAIYYVPATATCSKSSASSTSSSSASGTSSASKADVVLGTRAGNQIVARYFNELPEGKKGPWVIEIIKGTFPEEFLVRGINVIPGLEGKGYLNEGSGYAGTAEPANFPSDSLAYAYNKCSKPDGAIYYLPKSSLCPKASSGKPTSEVSSPGGSTGATADATSGSTSGSATPSSTATETKPGGTSFNPDNYVLDQSFTGYEMNGEPVPAELFLENEFVKIGVRKEAGGTVTHFSMKGRQNVINNSDWTGRQFQWAIYNYPVPYLKDHPSFDSNWPNIGWNPVEGGDSRGNPSPVEVMRLSPDKKTLYTRSRPYHWGLVMVPGEVVLEKWIRLDGKAAHVHVRYRYNVKDQNKYLARQSELPCLYAVGAMTRFWGYFDDRPFENQPMKELGINERRDRGQVINSTESWLAVSNNENNYAVGLYIPNGGSRFTKNKFPENGYEPTWEDRAFSASYIGHVPQVLQNYNGVYEFDAVAIMGNGVQEIRDYVYSMPRSENRPQYTFAKHVGPFNYNNGNNTEGTHSSFPLNGEFGFTFQNGKLELNAPSKFFKASSVKKLVIEAAFKFNDSNKTHAMAFVFKKPTDLENGVEKEIGPYPGRSFPFMVYNDNQFHTYEVDLDAYSEWSGGVVQWQIAMNDYKDTVTSGEARFKSISYR